VQKMIGTSTSNCRTLTMKSDGISIDCEVFLRDLCVLCGSRLSSGKLIRPFGKPPALPVRLEKAMPLRRKKKTIPLGVGSHGVERNRHERVAKFSPCKMGM
jgi:hypothetical protein